MLKYSGLVLNAVLLIILNSLLHKWKNEKKIKIEGHSRER